FIASDGGLSDTLTVQVQVTNVNRAPVWAAAGAKNVNEGQHLEFKVSATDPDLDALTIVALSLPANASIADSGNGAAGVFFDPNYTQAGIVNVILEVSDGDLTDTLGVSITVNNTNRAPILDPVAGGSVNVGDSLIIALHATDPDGDPVTLSLSAPLANAEVVDSGNGAGIFRFLPDSSQAGQNFSRSIIASDGDLDASDVFNFSVNALAAPDSAFVSVDTLFFVPGEVQDGVDNKVVALTSTNAPANYSSSVDPGAYPDFTTVTGSGQTDDSVDIEVDVTGYENGFYYNTVNFTVDGVDNNPVQLVVCVEVNNATTDTASLTPDTLFFTAMEGSEIIQSGCAYLSSTNAPANWTAVNDTDNVFASAILLSGVTGDSVCVDADPTGLGVGTYYDHVFYSVENTNNSPRTLVLCMTIEAAPSPDSAFVAPDTFFYSMDEGNNPGYAGCAMVTSTNAPASFTAGATGDPLFTDLLAAGGTTNDSLCFEIVNANGLTPGVYYNDV
ncbi:MAG TPA: Ig-like domain-containing protein, partial [candidate division Zixibacteria bacterium]|nr:Ig-like domain-containing protein [candidate division Zixibacteria bacterium]